MGASVFRGAALNAVAHGALILAAWAAVQRFPTALEGAAGGWPTSSWLIAALAMPIVHQSWVWFWWRTQYELGLPERLFGLRPAFRIYGVGFVVLAFFRVYTAFGVAAANAGTLAMSTTLASVLTVALLLPVIWLFYSIHRYFGFSHALGADHYFEEHRTRELCREGIFRYVPNAMYTVGFLSFWAIALAYRSQAALIVAAFNHVSIWIHYFALERPDMRRIYGPRLG